MSLGRMRNSFLAVMAVALLSFAGCADNADDREGDGERFEPSQHPLDLPTAAYYHTPPREFGGPAMYALVTPGNASLVPVGGANYLPVSTFEPSIGSDPDGCLYFSHSFTRPEGTASGTRIFMSCDQGLTWKEIGPYLPVGGQDCLANGTDPYVHVDRDTGRVFASDLHFLLSSTLHFTDDKGATWTCNPAGAGTPPGVHDHQSVATGPSRVLSTVGYDNVVYYCVNRVADSACSSSLDGGVGFGPLIPVYPGVESPSEGEVPVLCGGLTGQVETDHAGRVLLPKNQCGHPEVAVSEDNGLTWTRHIVSTITGVQGLGHMVRVAADQADNLYAFYIGADGLPYLARSDTNGRSWNDPWMVASPGVTATGFPAVYAAGENRVAFAYIGMTHPSGYEAPVEEMAWNAYIGIIENASEDHPTIATVTANHPGDPIDRGRPCGRIWCTALGDFIDLTITPEGRPYASFADMCFKECSTPEGTQSTGGTYGFAGTFMSGPSLLDGTPLTPMPVQDQSFLPSLPR